MIVGLGLGTAMGIGLAVAFWGFFPPREPLNTRLSAFEQPAGRRGEGERRRRLVGRVAIKWSEHHEWYGGRAEQDLRIAGQSAEELAVAKLGMLLFGSGLPVGMWMVSWLARVWISPVLVVVASVFAGGLFFFAPDLSLRQKARNRRRELMHQISAYLDLVSLRLTGGVGLERALAESAAQGTAWGFVEFKRALGQAQLANEPPWIAFERLGQDLGTKELEELAAWLHLAGTSGSRVRSALRVKARGLRERALNEAETQAQQATERMSLPVVLMFSGFLGLIGYPAFAALASA